MLRKLEDSITQIVEQLGLNSSHSSAKTPTTVLLLFCNTSKYALRCKLYRTNNFYYVVEGAIIYRSMLSSHYGLFKNLLKRVVSFRWV